MLNTLKYPLSQISRPLLNFCCQVNLLYLYLPLFSLDEQSFWLEPRMNIVGIQFIANLGQYYNWLQPSSKSQLRKRDDA